MKIPLPIYIVFLVVLAAAFLSFGGVWVSLTLQGKPVPDALTTWLFSSLTALIGLVLQAERPDAQ
jgi:hypothetical protein